MEKKICGIYMIKNKNNGKIYIGQTVDFIRRMNEYKNRKASESKSSSYTIMQIIEEEGFDNFIMKIIHECNQNELDFYEMEYIRKYKSYIPKYGYNSFHLNEDGKLMLNDSTRKKMSKTHKGMKESASTKRKKSNKIIAIDDSNHIMIISDSGKLFGDKIGVSKDMIKNGLRQPSRIKGYRLYYDDKNKRKQIVDKMHKKRCIRDLNYIVYSNYLDYSSVETIEKDFIIYYLRYEDFE